ncbi:GspH/FimT family protein [Luteimonas sp. A277]
MHQVSADLAMARSTAIMRRAQVVVCPRTADYRCRNDSDWGQGWMVFTGERLAGTVVVNNLGRVRSARPALETPCPRG